MIKLRATTCAAAALNLLLLGCGSTSGENSSSARTAASAKALADRQLADAKSLSEAREATAEYDKNMAAAHAKTMAASANLEAAQANLADTDRVIAKAVSLNAEDPVKMQRLISSCTADLGVPMQGAGSIQIMKCIEERW